MLKRIDYNLERFENGEWTDLFGSYDLDDVIAWRGQCSRKIPGEYRITELTESYAIHIQNINATRMSLPIEDEAVFLSEKSFLEYIAKLDGFSVDYLSTFGNQVIRDDADSIYLVTRIEGPTKDGIEFRQRIGILFPTEEDADNYTDGFVNSDDFWDQKEDRINQDRRLKIRFAKRRVLVIP